MIKKVNTSRKLAFRVMLLLIICGKVLFYSEKVFAQGDSDSIFYDYIKTELITGIVFRIVDSRQIFQRIDHYGYQLPFEGIKEGYFFTEEGNEKRQKYLIKRFLKGKSNKYYLFCNNLNLKRLQSWVPLKEKIDIEKCNLSEIVKNFEPYGKYNKYVIFSANARVKLQIIEVDSFILKKTNFTDLLVPNLSHHKGRIQIVLIEPL